MRTWVNAALCCALFAATSALAQDAPPLPIASPSPVIGVGNFAHSVSNLDQTVAFYRDVIGLELGGDIRKAAINPNIDKLTGTPKATFRGATFKIPGAAFRLELTEFTGIDRKQAQAGHWDPGTAAIYFRVRDIEPVFAAIKKAGTPIVTLSGAPVVNGQNGINKSIFIRDPDGYLVEVVQSPVPADAPDGNVFGGSMGLTVNDTMETLKFYRGLLGFDIKPAARFGGNKVILDIVGAQDGMFKVSAGNVPGTAAARIEFVEFKDTERKPFRQAIGDPGAASFSLHVSDVDALLKQLKAAGVPVVSEGGEPVRMSANSKNVFVRDPDGMFIELIQSKP